MSETNLSETNEPAYRSLPLAQPLGREGASKRSAVAKPGSNSDGDDRIEWSNFSNVKKRKTEKRIGPESRQTATFTTNRTENGIGHQVASTPLTPFHRQNMEHEFKYSPAVKFHFCKFCGVKKTIAPEKCRGGLTFHRNI
jgi:hypothetical protein